MDLKVLQSLDNLYSLDNLDNHNLDTFKILNKKKSV